MTLRPAVLVALATLACGAASEAPAPQSLEDTLAQFLSAVKANETDRMGALWGTERGPASDWMKAEELRQRLTVIQRYLSHAGYRVVEGPLAVPSRDNARTFRVELQRATGCNVVVPIDLVRAKTGRWFVNDVHLEAAGNPSAGCRR